ncbi:MAG: sensor histidine kinase [Labilithrix sp.]|nr:sensor histidine kinase [Labilithrix sp.]
MKNDDPRFPRGGYSDPGGRDTRLDPIEDMPDATQPGSVLSPPAAADLVTPHSPQPPFTPGRPPGPGAAPWPSPSQPGARPTPVETHVALYPNADLGPSADLGPGADLDPSAAIGSMPPGPDALRPSDVPPASAAFLPRAPRLRTGWPFLPLAPLLVVVVGLAVALGIGLVGLDQLSRAGDEHAGARAELIAATVAARLGALSESSRLDATQLAARRSAAELLVVTARGEIIHDQTLGAPDGAALQKMLSTGRGVAETRIGRARYAVRAIGPAADPSAPRLVVLVPEPRAAVGANALASALAALAVLLLGVAAGVAYAVSRDVTRDVDFVTHRVRAMAQVRTEPTGELIPARTMDEVGLLTATFNKLVGRFGIASGAYRGDLARASAADRERAAFLAAVSHELRSPLNAILGFADILMEEVDGPLSPSAKEEVEQIRGSGAHLLSLINDILEFSALESGQLRLTRGRVDVLALATEVMREARGLVGQKPLSVRVVGEPLIARVDGRRVRQILGNLVNNAIKFTQRGEVVVVVRREGMMAAFLVSDTGPGISPQERAVIFEEYKQARSEQFRRRGTGLGLAITRRLVMLHHGSISVESELGRGSTFKVLLPIGNIDAPPSRKLSRPPGAHLLPGQSGHPGGPVRSR